MKYVIYTRISEENKTKVRNEITGIEESQELGLEKQLDKCLQYCKGKEHIHFQDKDSGGKLKLEKREVLMEAIEKCEKGDILLVYEPDRLARSNEVAVVKYLLRQKKAKLAFADGTKVDSNELNDIILENSKNLVSVIEGHKISVRTRQALERKKRKGERYGIIPFGYKLDMTRIQTITREGVTTTRHYLLIQCDEEMRALIRMKQLRQQGVSFRDIPELLAEEGYLNRKGNPFQPMSIWKILKSQGHDEAMDEQFQQSLVFG